MVKKTVEVKTEGLALSVNKFTLPLLFVFLLYSYPSMVVGFVYGAIVGSVAGIIIGSSIVLPIAIGFAIMDAIFRREFSKPPGHYLSKTSDSIFSKKDQEDIFEPIVADWHEEYFEAVFKGEIWKARWINIRYIYAFIMVMCQKVFD